MNVDAHVSTLEKKHANLETLIDEEAQRPAPNPYQLAEWKKEKLRIKEELFRLGARH